MFVKSTAWIAAIALLVIAYLWPLIVILTTIGLVPSAELRVTLLSASDWVMFLLAFAAAGWLIDLVGRWALAQSALITPLKPYATAISTAVESALIVALFQVVLSPLPVAIAAALVTIVVGVVGDRLLDRLPGDQHN